MFSLWLGLPLRFRTVTMRASCVDDVSPEICTCFSSASFKIFWSLCETGNEHKQHSLFLWQLENWRIVLGWFSITAATKKSFKIFKLKILQWLFKSFWHISSDSPPKPPKFYDVGIRLCSEHISPGFSLWPPPGLKSTWRCSGVKTSDFPVRNACRDCKIMWHGNCQQANPLDLLVFFSSLVSKTYFFLGFRQYQIQPQMCMEKMVRWGWFYLKSSDWIWLKWQTCLLSCFGWWCDMSRCGLWGRLSKGSFPWNPWNLKITYVYQKTNAKHFGETTSP